MYFFAPASARGLLPIGHTLVDTVMHVNDLVLDERGTIDCLQYECRHKRVISLLAGKTGPVRIRREKETSVRPPMTGTGEGERDELEQIGDGVAGLAGVIPSPCRVVSWRPAFENKRWRERSEAQRSAVARVGV